MVIARGVSGELGIMPGHTPILVALKPHAMRIKIEGSNNEEILAVSGGFLEVSKDKITVLARTAELPEEIDVARARAALERAEKLLEKQDDNIDHARARTSLQRALTRINVAQK